MANFSGNDIKRRRELFQLNRFKDCFPDLGIYIVSLVEDDPPDGVIEFRGKMVSVELTQILWDLDSDGMNKKIQENTSDMIMDLAEEKYNKLKRFPYLQINVSFTDKYGHSKNGEALNLNSGDKEILSNYIVDKVIESTPTNEKELFKVPEFDETWQRLLHPKIQSIYITRHPMLSENCWSASGGGVVPHISIGKIQERITEKNRKVIEYGKLYDESWLIIVEDTKGISGYFDFQNAEDVISHKFESKFHRVFILRNGKMEVLELKIAL